MTRTIALLRVSTDDQTADAQRGAILRAAPAHGIDPSAIDWRDEGTVSGASPDRPVLEGVMADARRGRVGVVVVAALDRLGRSTVDLLVRLDELHRLGVRVISLRESLDFASTSGRLVAGVLASIAEFERAIIRDRTLAGMAAAAAAGRHPGRPGFEWRAEELAELRGLVASGRTLAEVHATGGVKVFDARGVARVPSVRSMRRALAAGRSPVSA